MSIYTKIKNRTKWILSYPVDFFYKLVWKAPEVYDIEDTLRELIERNASISRFGDGELDIMAGRSIPFQKYDNDLAEKMKLILKTEYEDFFVGIPDIFKGLSIYNDRARDYYRNHLRNNRKIWAHLLNSRKKYYCTGMTRPYMDLVNKSNSKKYFELLGQIWNGKKVVIVEGEKSRLGIGNDLFNECQEIKRILCPPTDAFSFYDAIISEVEGFSKDYLILLALGPTATVMAFDLYKKGYRALDIGHVDIEYEWYRMGATSKIPVENKYTNEAESIGGLDVGESIDKVYHSQIYAKIGC